MRTVGWIAALLVVTAAGLVFSARQASEQQERMRAIEVKMRDFEKALSRLAATPPGPVADADPASVVPPPPAGDPPKSTVAAPSSAAAAPADPDFHAAVRAAVDEAMKERNEERRRRGLEQQAKAIVEEWDWKSMLEDMDLTEAQAAAMKAIFEEEGRSLRALAEAPGEVDPEARLKALRQKTRELRRSFYDQVRSLLSPAQLTDLKSTLGFPDRETSVLDRWNWEDLKQAGLKDEMRSSVDDKLRELNELADRLRDDPAQAERLRQRSQELQEALVREAEPQLTPDQLRRLQESLRDGGELTDQILRIHPAQGGVYQAAPR